MACPTERVANIIGEFDWQVTRVGVRLRLCGRRLRSRSPWSGAEVDGVGFFGACTLVQGWRSHVHRDMSPEGALGRHGWTDTLLNAHVRTTTTTTQPYNHTTTTTTTNPRHG